MTDFLADLETAIADRLAPLTDYGLDVINSPHRCSSGREKAIALFYFTDTSAEERKGCTQNRTVNLQVEIKGCDPRSHHVVYPFIEAVDFLLDNWSPGVGKSGRIQFESVRYVPVQTKQGVEWLYDLTFKLKTIKCDKKGDLEAAIAEIFA